MKSSDNHNSRQESFGGNKLFNTAWLSLTSSITWIIHYSLLCLFSPLHENPKLTAALLQSGRNSSRVTNMMAAPCSPFLLPCSDDSPVISLPQGGDREQAYSLSRCRLGRIRIERSHRGDQILNNSSASLGNGDETT